MNVNQAISYLQELEGFDKAISSEKNHWSLTTLSVFIEEIESYGFRYIDNAEFPDENNVEIILYENINGQN